MKNLLALILCLLPAGALLNPVPAWGEAAPDWTAVETVQVQAPPGPALWHVTRGESEVWILGTVGPMPADLKWNRAVLTELIDGARTVLMPPRASIGIFEGAWLLLTNGSKLSLPRGQSLEATLPDNLRKHVVAVRAALGRDEGRYRTDSPARAAWRLQSDFQDKAKLSGAEPRRSVSEIARAKHVPLTAIAQYEIADAIKDVLNLSQAQQQACLAEELEDIDRLGAHGTAAAKAWAVGDLRTMKENYAQSRLLDCVIAAANSVADINERSVADTTAAIDKALAQPGKTVVMIGLGPLLRTNGILQRLAAKGAAIEGPAD